MLVGAAAAGAGCVGVVSGSGDADAGVEPDAGVALEDAGVLDAGPTVPEPTGFATGPEQGTFANELWTPGRDASGSVNLDSWQLVPRGRWVRVAGTRLDGLDAVVKAALPGWQDYGSGRWVAVTHAWNGVAIDPAGCRAWWVCAGGHADSSNNGIYRFDSYKMAWAVEKLPSDTTPWSEQYKRLQAPQPGSFTPCWESDQQFRLARDAGPLQVKDGWYNDELFWDRQPTSRHVYSGVAYVAERDELVLAVRRLWRFSRASGQWTSKRLFGDDASASVGEEVVAHYDQSRDQLLVFSCGSNGPWGNTFDFGADRWTGQAPRGTGWDFNAAADARHGDRLTLFKWPEDPSNTYASPGRYLSYDLVTRAVLASGQVQFAGGLSQADFTFGSDGGGMVYVPPLDRYWTVLELKAGGVAWCELDPTTTPWTLRPLVHEGAVPALSSSRIVRRRMAWMPDLSAVVFFGSADRDVGVFKV